MADGTPDVQGPAKLPGNPDGIDLDAIKAILDRNGILTYTRALALVAEVERLRADADRTSSYDELSLIIAERDGLLARIRAVEARIEWLCADAERRTRIGTPEVAVDDLRAAMAVPAGESADPDCAPSGAESGSLPTARAAGGRIVTADDEGGDRG